ncbi:MAG: 5'-3' exonuclease H3TH domain-containing protein, partial [Actinomycetes bacterium]
MSKPTLLLIDGHSLAFRAFYALSPDSFRIPSGQHTNAVHGFISMMLNILQNEKPTHLAVAFDLSRSSFRTDEYPEYKGTRGETPPEFNGQTELLEEALRAMGIITLTKVNYEADDIIASLADQGAAAGYRVLIVSGDRDTFQLIQDDVTILYPVKGVMNLNRMNDAAVVERYGIHAKQYPDLAALVGETSDNLPGVPGVGPKTAAKWLVQYGDLEGVLKAASDIPGKVGESLREHQGLAVRNRRLNHLVRDLDIGYSFDAFVLKPVEEDKVRETFAKLQFRSLLERVLKARGTTGVKATTDDVVENETSSAITKVLKPTAELATENSVDLKAMTSSKEPIAISLRFEEQGDRSLLEIGLAVSNGRVSISGNAINQEVSEFLASTTKKIVYDSKNTERSLIEIGLSLNGVVADPLLAAYVDNPLRKGYTVESLVEEYLGIVITAPSDEIGAILPSASELAWYLYQLQTAIDVHLTESKQIGVYTDVELASSHTLAKMETAG